MELTESPTPGTRANSGQSARSTGSLALKIGSTCSPFSRKPLPSKKKAPVVSPAHAGISSPTMPASEMPELNVYWLLVPLGQTEPGIVEEPVESTQIWPLEIRPHCTWLTLIEPLARASRRKPVDLIGRSGRTAAPAAGAASVTASATSHAETTFADKEGVALRPL